MLTSIERHLVATLRAAGASALREVSAVPAQLDEAELRRILSLAPGLFVSFLGGQRIAAARATISSRWAVYVVAANAAGTELQRQGSPEVIGAYDMIELTITALERHVVPEVGALELLDVANLFSDAFTKLGRTVYGVTFGLPVALPDEIDTSALADFATFHANWDVPAFGNVQPPLPADDTADATDHVTLETI